MTTFIYTIAITAGIEVLCKLVLLATGTEPKRTPASLAIDIFCGVVFVVWAAVLLSK